MPINQHICLCQELRDLLKGKHSVSLEMTLLYCLLCSHKTFAREAVEPSFFSCSPLPSRSDCLKVLFTNLCLPRQEHESETVLCRNLQNPQDGRQCAAVHVTGVISLSVWGAESSSPGSSQFQTAFCCSCLSAGHI